MCTSLLRILYIANILPGNLKYLSYLYIKQILNYCYVCSVQNIIKFPYQYQIIFNLINNIFISLFSQTETYKCISMTKTPLVCIHIRSNFNVMCQDSVTSVAIIILYTKTLTICIRILNSMFGKSLHILEYKHCSVQGMTKI